MPNEVEDAIIVGEPIFYAHTLSKKLKQLKLVPISDAHYDNPLFSEHHFMNTLRMLGEHDTYGVLNGDLIEAVTRKSIGDIYKQKKAPKEQAKWIVKRLMPYKKKLLGSTLGNHEYRIYKEIGDDYSEYIAEELGIPYRSSGLLLKISFGDRNKGVEGRPYVYWVYLTHGYGGARTKAKMQVARW